MAAKRALQQISHHREPSQTHSGTLKHILLSFCERMFSVA